MKSQNATATLGNITSCAGENVLVPLDVTGFSDVGAMTIYIAYDTTEAEFLTIQNINPAIPGFVSFNGADGIINIAYSFTIPFNIIDDKLFDLSFNFLGDSTNLPFNPGTEIANSNLEIIPLDTYPGSIKNSVQLINQPDSVQSYPDNDVTFRVTSQGSPNYQWQENTGSGWIDLENNSTYSGVDNDTLTIHDVPLSFNGYTYRCELADGECMVISDTALLEVALAFPVATLGYISSCPENIILEPVYVGDFLDIVEFTFNISYDTANLDFQNLENIDPDILAGTLTVSPLIDPAGLVIHWISADPVSITSGKLFDMMFDYETQSLPLRFEDGTIVLNSFSNPVDITLNNGAVTQYAVPVIVMQPQNDTVFELQDAVFQLEASETDNYQWQVSTNMGESWNDLTNTIPYYNVTTPELTISPATFSMNGYQYACRLENENCTSYSAAATLVVDTLTSVSSRNNDNSIQVYPVPCQNKVHVSLPDDSPFTLIGVYNSHGMLLITENMNQHDIQKNMILDLSAFANGLYLIKLTGSRDGLSLTEQKIIIKTN